MKQLFYIAILVIWIGCSALIESPTSSDKTFQQPLGAFKNSNDLMTRYLILRRDSSFSYSMVGHLAEQRSAGTWKRIGNLVTIKSDSIYLNQEMKVTEHVIKPKSTKVQLRFQDGKNRPWTLGSIRLNDSKESINLREIGGTIDIEGSEFRSFSFSSLFVDDTLQFKRKDVNSNRFNITITPTDRGLIYLNDTLQVRNLDVLDFRNSRFVRVLE